MPESSSVGDSSGIVQPPKEKRHWPKTLWKYSPYIISSIVIIYIVFVSNIFIINRVEVQGPNTGLSQDLKSEVDRYLTTNLLSKNWLFLNSADLKSKLQKTFTGQESIIVKKDFPNKLSVKTDEQKTGIVWKTGSRRYLVSLNGRAMSEVQQGQNISDLAVVVDGSSIPINAGDNILSRSFVDFIIQLNSYLKLNKLGPEQISISETTSEVTAKTSLGYDIRLNTTESAESQLRGLNGVFDNLKSQNKKPTQYIDVRVPGRAFYK